MSVQFERLEDRAHCQSLLVALPSPSVRLASNRVWESTQPLGGVMVTTPSSSTSATVTVTSAVTVRRFDPLETSVATTVNV